MQFRHILLALTIALVWGSNFIVAKIGMDEIPPFLILTLRFIFASLPFVFFVPKPKEVSWSLMTAIALLLFVGKFSFVFMSINLGFSSGLASLLLQTQVLFTIILSKIFCKSKISQRQAIGMIVSFMGIGLIAQDMDSGASIPGFLCTMGGALMWAFSNILLRKAKNADAFALVIWMGIIPILPLFCFSLIFEGSDVILHSLTHISYKGVLAIAFIVIAATWIGTTLWAYLFKIYDASVVAPYGLLIPVFGISLSWLFLGETYTFITLIGCLFVFLGLVINQFSWGRNSYKER